MVEHKDVVIAVVGVSAGLAGLALVFLGFVLTTYQGFETDTPKKVKDKYLLAAKLVLAAFAIGMLCVVLATTWLVLLKRAEGLYVSVVLVFLAQIVSLVATATYAVYRLIK